MSDFDDDSLVLEALENVEKLVYQESSILSTPPDSEILKNQVGQNTSTRIDKEQISAVKENNFQSKLMKSLLNNRNISGQVAHSPIKTLIDDSLSHCNKNSKRKSDNVLESSDISSKICRTLPELNKKCFQEAQNQRKNVVQYSFSERSTGMLGASPKNESIALNDILDTSFIQKRKFPGPAGLLPEWGHQSLAKSCIGQHKNEDSLYLGSKDSVRSQSSAQDFVSGPWKEVLHDLVKTEGWSNRLLQHNNVRWILRRANLRGLASMRKIAFLVVMVRSIDLSHTDAPAVFHDETGEINGTISKGVLEQYSEHISNGTVLVLRDVTILSPASFQSGMRVIGQLKKHYLNITLNSIISIYSVDDEERVRKIEVTKLTRGLLISLSNSDGRSEKKEVVENKEDDEQITTLFSNVSEGTGAAATLQGNIKTNPCSSRGFSRCRSLLATGSRSPVVGGSLNRSFVAPQPLQTISNQSAEQSTTAHSWPQSLPEIEPCGGNFAFNFKKFEAGSESRNGTPEAVLANTRKEMLNVFADPDDEDELDSLLASIDTDSL